MDDQTADSTVEKAPRAMHWDHLVLPDTPAGLRLGAYVTAFNSGYDAVMRTFVAEHVAAPALAQRSVAQRASGDAMTYHVTHGLDARRIESSSEHAIEVLLQARLDASWMRLRLTVSADPPHGITTIDVSPAPRPADVRPHGSVSEQDLAREVTALVDTLVAADVFSGAVLVAKDGVPLVTLARGLASRGYDVANRIDTKFNLGSMNKMFTAVAIVQLAEQGKLAFDDPISTFLPDYPAAVARTATIHHLLTHTSGLGSYFNHKFAAAQARLRRVQDFLTLFRDDPPSFAPGERFQYSNAGYIVLGAIIEAVSGQDYYAYVRDHVYGPAGMVNTDAYELDWDVPNMAIGYTHRDLDGLFDPGPRRNILFRQGLRGGPAGGGYSTVEDLLRFATALRTHQLLSAPYTDIALSGKVEAGPTMKRAYGFVEQCVNDTRILGHGGGFPGVNSYLDMYPERGYTLAVLANYDPPAAELISRKVRDMLTQQ